jgi:hypothetical protein
MGQLTNQFVSSSYQGLLKMTDSTQGLQPTLQTVQSGDGTNSPLQMSETEVNISGSFFINGVQITNGTNGTSGTSGINGTNGSSGTSGSNGSSGTSGSSGGSGSSGSGGTSGTSGSSGSNGTDGTSGTSGSSGSDGTSGSSGSDGSSGSSGSDGSSGTSGSSGTGGSDGSSGTSGSSGSDGTSGSSGSDGTSGTSGSSGSDGSSGTSGSSGTGGSDGSSGTSGSSGSSGTDGTSGSSGTDGTSGSSGTSGQNGISAGRTYYFNQSQSSDVSPYKVLSDEPTTGTTQTVTKNLTNTQQNVLVSEYITPQLGFSLIPAGVQRFHLHLLKPASNDDIDVYVTLQLANSTGGTIGSVITSSSNIIGWNSGDPAEVEVDVVLTSITIDPTNRFIVKIYLNNNESSSHNVIYYTEGSEYSYVITSVGVVAGSSGTSGSSGSSGTSGDSIFVQTGSFYNTTNNIGITGSFNVKGDITLSGSIIGNTVNGGIIKIQSQLNTSSSLSIPFGYITNSNPDLQTNLIFGTTTSTSGSGLLTNTQTGSIVISGSNNILLGGGNRATTLNLGTYGYLGGNNNIGSVYPTLGTGSILRPTIQNNALQSGLNLQFTTSSLATPFFGANLIYGGTNINHQSGSINFSQNSLIGGGLNSNQNITTPNQIATISQNIFSSGLNTNLNHNSSSISYAGNIGAIVVNNNYSSSVSAAVDNITVNQNLFNGNGINLTVTGSNSGTRRTFNSNLISGRSNLVNSNFDTGTGSFTGGHLVSTTLLGEQLIVSASHTNNGVGGTVFVGRFNATGSLQESSQDTVFVVGSGTSAGARRNALRIDNNSNSNFTGSVRIAAPSNFGHSPSLIVGSFDNTNAAANITGSVSVSGSIILNGVAITPSDRNGLITTGSIGSSQTIAGRLTISGSLTQPLQIGSGENISKIANVNNNTFLYRNSDTNNTVLGNVDAANNDSFTSGSNLNMLFTGFFLGFTSGSANTVIAGGGGAQFRSGSNNTIIGKTAELEFGNNNTYIGDVSGTPALESDTLRISAGGSTILKKSGSLALQINSNTQVTGSLVVDNVLQLIPTTTDPVTTSGVEGQLRFFDYGGSKQVLLYISGSGWVTLA